MTASDEVFENPASRFASPQDVVLNEAIGPAHKLQILDNWMAKEPENQKLHRLIERAKDEINNPVTRDVPNEIPPPNRSWEFGNSGQGGEGLSKGYGGSEGAGVGPAGPEDK